MGIPSHWRFAAMFIAVFFVSSVALYVVDFVPEKPSDKHGIVAGATTTATMTPEAPVSITIPAIGVNTSISNPATTSVPILDTALLSGAVRYPTSAVLGQMGTVYLFGHQSYLPVVHNKAFKAFNDLQKLKAGDTITVSSDTADYTYTVRSITLTTAAQGVVPLESNSRTLVLSTCNSFSSDHQERYIVIADFITKTPRT
jgi:LPXTG-site transpeptidase (sortase) family protein